MTQLGDDGRMLKRRRQPVEEMSWNVFWRGKRPVGEGELLVDQRPQRDGRLGCELGKRHFTVTTDHKHRVQHPGSAVLPPRDILSLGSSLPTSV